MNRRAPQATRPAATMSRRDDRGDAMVVWCLLLAIMLLPLGGLSVDLWHGIQVQRQLQSAAEDAALAGSSGVNVQEYRADGCIVLDPATAVALAQANLASQTGLGPLAASNFAVAANGQQLTVSLQQSVRLTLLSLVEGKGSFTVSAVATSGPRGSQAAAGCPAPGSGAVP